MGIFIRGLKSSACSTWFCQFSYYRHPLCIYVITIKKKPWIWERAGQGMMWGVGGTRGKEGSYVTVTLKTKTSTFKNCHYRKFGKQWSWKGKTEITAGSSTYKGLLFQYISLKVFFLMHFEKCNRCIQVTKLFFHLFFKTHFEYYFLELIVLM